MYRISVVSFFDIREYHEWIRRNLSYIVTFTLYNYGKIEMTNSLQKVFKI